MTFYPGFILNYSASPLDFLICSDICIYMHTHMALVSFGQNKAVPGFTDLLIYLLCFKCLCYESRGWMRERGMRHILYFLLFLCPFVSSFLPPAPSSLSPLLPAIKSWCWCLSCVSLSQDCCLLLTNKIIFLVSCILLGALQPVIPVTTFFLVSHRVFINAFFIAALQGITRDVL